MQTFLPYASYEASAKVLDYRRLGKQRVESYQILGVIFGIRFNKETEVWEPFDYRWKNHPAVKMWSCGSEFQKLSYALSLCEYTHSIIDEWIERGYNDTLKEKISWFEGYIQSLASEKVHRISPSKNQ